MHFIRCRNFSDDGTSRQPCRAGCKFVHPDSANWAKASRSKKGTGGNFRGDRRPSMSDNGWKTRETFTKSRSAAWDTTSWGIPKHDTHSSESTTWSRRESQVQPITSQMDGIDNGWGSPNIKSKTWRDTEWGEKETNDFGKNGTSGWGESSASDLGEKSSWWGESTGSGWGKGESSGWGTGESSGWGKGDVSGWGKGDTTSGWGKNDTSKRTIIDRRSSNASSVGNKSDSRLNEPPKPTLSLSRTVPESPSLSKAVVESPNVATPVSETSISSKQVSQSAASVIGLPEVPKPEPVYSQADLYRMIIKRIQHAVRYQLELNDTQASIESWRRMQNSQYFSRATFVTRDILDSRRKAYAQEAVELKAHLDSKIKRLSALQDLSFNQTTSIPPLKEPEIPAYIKQLRDWLNTISVSHRQKPASLSVPSPIVEKQTSPRLATWNDIQTRMDSINNLIAAVDHELYPRPPLSVDIESRVSTLKDTIQAKYNDQLPEKEALISSLRDDTDGVGKDIEKLALTMADLLLTVHRNSQTLEMLKSQLLQNKEASEEMQGFLRQCEEWRSQDSAIIQNLTERLKNLHATARPSHPSLTADDLIPELEKLTTNTIQDDITRVIASIREACKKGGDEIGARLFVQLQPILNKTEEICRRAETVASASVTH